MASTPAVLDSTIELKIDFGHGADARQAGIILSRLATAYSQHSRDLGVRNARLVVRRIEIGSLLAFLEGVVDVLKGGKVLYDNSQLVGSFMYDLSGIIMTLQSGEPVAAPSFMRSLVKALTSSIKLGNANSTRIKIAGPTGHTIEIDTQDARVIDKALRLSHDILRAPNQSSLKLTQAPQDWLVPSGLELADHSAANRALPGPQLQAMLLYAFGRWYARPATMDGVMLPAEIGPHLPPVLTTSQYLVTGLALPSGATPKRFRILSVDRRTD